jgi:hypothetical protein
MVLPQDVMCMMIYVMYAIIIFCNVSRLACRCGMSHMVVFVILYDLRVNFLYAM